MAKQNRPRLDLLLVERGLFPTRAKAQAAVMAGQVLVEGRPQTKPGTPTWTEARLEILAPCPYVSRGGLKLEAALERFPVRVAGRVFLDLGSSTGGFTDCLLQRGAAKVYAVDVGRAQLHDKLRKNPRVVSFEQTHARSLRPELFDPRPELLVADVSFISLTKALPQAMACLKRPFEAIALIKPQFELEPKLVPKGVVRDPEARVKAIERVRALLPSLGLQELGLMECPVRGTKGNVEFFIYLRSH